MQSGRCTCGRCKGNPAHLSIFSPESLAHHDFRADSIYDAERERTLTLPFPYRFKRVGGLAALRYGDKNRLLVKYRIAIPEFTAKLHLYGHICEFFKHVLADKSRVVCRAAPDDDNALHFLQLLFDTLESAELHETLLRHETPAHRVHYNFGTFYYLFE